MKCNASNIVGVAFEGHDRVRIGGLNIIESDDMATSSSEEFLVRSDAEAVHLRFRMLNSSRAYARKSFPEASPSVRWKHCIWYRQKAFTVSYGRTQLCRLSMNLIERAQQTYQCRE